jgi:hypothetical protein
MLYFLGLECTKGRYLDGFAALIGCEMFEALIGCEIFETLIVVCEYVGTLIELSCASAVLDSTNAATLRVTISTDRFITVSD